MSMNRRPVSFSLTWSSLFGSFFPSSHGLNFGRWMMNVEIMHLCLHPQIIEKVLLIALHHHWYKGESLHAFSATLVCVIVSGTAIYLFHPQWYVDELSIFISSVVRWY